MAEDMIERVAKAMRRNRFVRTRRMAAFDENVPPTENELDDARAAIKAMREPTLAMLNAGWRNVERPEDVELAPIWSAMIDAALSPQARKDDER